MATARRKASPDDRLMEWLNDRIGNHERVLGETISAIGGTIGSLGTKVEEIKLTLVQHVATEDTDRATIQRIEATVCGNGKPGLATRIAKLEWWGALVKGVIVSVILPVILYGGYVALQHWAAHPVEVHPTQANER